MKWWNEKWWWEFVLISNFWISCRLELRCQNIHEKQIQILTETTWTLNGLDVVSWSKIVVFCLLAVSTLLNECLNSIRCRQPILRFSRLLLRWEWRWCRHRSQELAALSNKRQIAPEKFSVKAKVERKESLNQPKWLCSFSWHSRLSLRSHSKSLKFTCSLYLLDSTRKFSFNARQMGGRRPAAEAGNFALSTAPSDVDPLCIDSSTRRK